MQHILTLTAEPELIPEVGRIAHEAGAEASEPEPLNLDGSLNAGLTFDELRQGLEAMTLLFKAAAGALAFLTALRAYLRDRNATAKISVGDGKGQILGHLDASTPDAQLARLAGSGA